VVAILGYHKIGPPGPGGWPTWFYVPEATFVEHLRMLAGDGWPVIGLDRFLAGLDDPAALPPRAALLTFDDAHRCLRQVALPALRRLRLPAVVFTPSAYVGGWSTFDASEPIEPLCDWSDLRALAAAGISVQSHGATHRAFSGLDAAQQERELCTSRQVLEQGLGRRVKAFAFPYGDPGPDPATVRIRLQRAGYRAAFGYGGGPVRLPADRYALPRIAMGPDTDLALALAAEPGP
jgi:peptidoglycan/xylan/chitin deacetylase (PgdA/CDA1 family)